MTLLKLDACAHCGHPVDATSPHVYVDIKESTFERRAFCGAICVRAAYYTDARLLHSLWKGKIA